MDGVEGLQLARRDKPDLVLCDLQMRKLDGFEVVRHARQEPELSDVRIVAVTAYAMREDQDKVMAAGFDGYITKPIVRKSSLAVQRSSSGLICFRALNREPV